MTFLFAASEEDDRCAGSAEISLDIELAVFFHCAGRAEAHGASGWAVLQAVAVCAGNRAEEGYHAAAVCAELFIYLKGAAGMP